MAGIGVTQELPTRAKGQQPELGGFQGNPKPAIFLHQRIHKNVERRAFNRGAVEQRQDNKHRRSRRAATHF